MSSAKKFCIYTRVSLTEDREKRAELSTIQRFKVMNGLRMAGHQVADECFGDYEIGQTNDRSRRPNLFAAINFARENGFGLAVSNLSRVGRTRSMIRLILEKLEIPVFVSDLRRLVTLDEALQINDRNCRQLSWAQAKRDRGAGIFASPLTTDLAPDAEADRRWRRRKLRPRRRTVRTFWMGNQDSGVFFGAAKHLRLDVTNWENTKNLPHRIEK